jgi:hypothetical protein
MGRGAITLGHCSRVGLDLAATIPTPDNQPDPGLSSVAQGHRRAALPHRRRRLTLGASEAFSGGGSSGRGAGGSSFARIAFSRVRKDEDFARCASFETRPKWPLLRMRSEISATYFTLRKPEGLSRRVPAQQIQIFPHPVRGSSRGESGYRSSSIVRRRSWARAAVSASVKSKVMIA